jgi:hypothetical protein
MHRLALRLPPSSTAAPALNLPRGQLQLAARHFAISQGARSRLALLREQGANSENSSKRKSVSVGVGGAAAPAARQKTAAMMGAGGRGAGGGAHPAAAAAAAVV